MDTEIEVNATVSGEQIGRAMECLRKNGIAEQRVETVLQELGLILLDVDFLPDGMV